MKIGISTWALGWSIGNNGYPFPLKPLNVKSVVEKAIYLNAQVIQIADNIHSEDKDLITASKILKQNEIILELGLKGTNAEMLEERIRFSAKCNISLIRTLPHCGADIPTPNEIADRIGKIVPILENENVVLALENHDYYSSKELKYVMESINSDHVGICLDTANNYGKGESYRETTELLHKYIKNFHYKEFVVKRIQNQMGFSIIGAPIGSGVLDIEYFTQWIPKSVNWIIEQWTPWQGSIDDTIRLENKWLSDGIVKLRSETKILV